VSGDPTCLQQVGTYYTHTLSLSLERETHTLTVARAVARPVHLHARERGCENRC
jgi:hypothetical protein